MKRLLAQHIFILLSLAAIVVCLFQTLIDFTYQDYSFATLTNFQIVSNGGKASSTPWALGALLIASATAQLFVLLIAAFRNYTLQKRALIFSMLLLAGYYLVYLVFVLILKNETLAVFPHWGTLLPLISIILSFMAFRGILHTEAKIIEMGNSFRLRD